MRGLGGRLQRLAAGLDDARQQEAGGRRSSDRQRGRVADQRACVLEEIVDILLTQRIGGVPNIVCRAARIVAVSRADLLVDLLGILNEQPGDLAERVAGPRLALLRILACLVLGLRAEFTGLGLRLVAQIGGTGLDLLSGRRSGVLGGFHRVGEGAVGPVGKRLGHRMTSN